ncbi:hypothetical protein LguiA_032471 [Lonicera macranthoides]
MEDASSKKRVRDESDESELGSPEVKRIRDDLLGFLDESEICTTSQDLDSFMKSFEKEITATSPSTVVDLTLDSGESRPDIDYLFEASDNELGLPPSTNSPSSNDIIRVVESDLVRVESDSSELCELWKFDEISGYDSFETGFGDDDNGYNNAGEYVALDGLFDYSDLGFLSSEFS